MAKFWQSRSLFYFPGIRTCHSTQAGFAVWQVGWCWAWHFFC
ncbi:MAG: hypothetical protein VKJ24_02565 [Synechococcales bacterium]|nr:hypothetical protein [Synechococcales bacterium]